MAGKAGRIWLEHGALQFVESAGDDLAIKGTASLPRAARAKRGETVVFSWIVYKSRAHGDRVNAKVMKDPRIARDDGPYADDHGPQAHGLRGIQNPGRPLIG